PPLDIAKLGKEQGVRYWLWGNTKRQGNMVLTSLILTDTKEEGKQWKTDLVLDPSDPLIEFRKGFLAWLDGCGLSFPEEQVAKALWPEKTTLKSLDLLGRDLKTYYLHSSWGDTTPLDSDLFDSAVSGAPSSYLAHDLKGWVMYKNKDYLPAEESFLSAVKINPNGLGAISGLMWCGVYTQDKDKAEKWAMIKADIRGESREKARADVKKRMEKAMQ
ncbi:MAG: hypothetical protein KJO26_08105, partial [Deltaproteobacteria bacterium]|nr:hypothetical protein [Deltaproteobacteria bacterium]